MSLQSDTKDSANFRGFEVQTAELDLPLKERDKTEKTLQQSNFREMSSICPVRGPFRKQQKYTKITLWNAEILGHLSQS